MTFSPFPFRLEAFAEKQDKSAIERKIKELKVQLQFLIQSNFPVLGATPFGDWTTRNYLDRHFSGEQMGQDWRKNMQIQHMLQELNQLEQDRKSLTQKSSAWKRMDEYTDKQLDAIDENEDEADEDIDREHNGPGVPSFVGKYSHGIEEHRNKLKRQTRELREREKKEAKRSADTDTPESILRRMGKYADMEIDIVKRNEKEEDNRIRRDHRNPNVPKKVRKRNHDYEEHTDDLLDEIKKLQRKERQDVKRQLGKSYDRFDDSELIKAKKRKKKKWPSFDTQSSQIARKEGVSEEDADAILASRGRNHGTKKSLSEMSLVEVYKATQGKRRTKPLSKVLDPSMFSAAADLVPDAGDLENLRDVKHGFHHALLPVSAALQNKRNAVDQQNAFTRMANHPKRKPLAETGMPPGLGLAQKVVGAAQKWTKPGSISGPVMGGIQQVRQRIGF